MRGAPAQDLELAWVWWASQQCGTRVQVHHEGQIEPAFPCAHVRNVGVSGGVRLWDGKSRLQRISLEELGDVAADIPGISKVVQGFQVISPHDPINSMLATGLACFTEVKKDLWDAAYPVTCRNAVRMISSNRDRLPLDQRGVYAIRHRIPYATRRGYGI